MFYDRGGFTTEGALRQRTPYDRGILTAEGWLRQKARYDRGHGKAERQQMTCSKNIAYFNSVTGEAGVRQREAYDRQVLTTQRPSYGVEVLTAERPLRQRDPYGRETLFNGFSGCRLASFGFSLNPVRREIYFGTC